MARCKSTPVFIPVRNGIHYTIPCVESVLAQDIPISVYLLDTGCVDGTRQWAQAKGYEGRFFYLRKLTKGVAASWNYGLHVLFAQGHDAVIILNNDTLLRPDTARLLATDGGGFVTAVGVGSHRQLWEPIVLAKRPHPDFSCFLIRRSVWEAVGPFDESMSGAYAEDSDYHVRMHRTGVEAYCIGVPFLHYASGTIKSATPEEAAAIGQQADRNREAFKARYGASVGSPEYEALFGPGTSQPRPQGQ